jgi:hypothetical protein
MLREITSVSQIAGEPLRRWFYDRDYDLIVWVDQATAVLGFQLCYGKSSQEQAVSWQAGSGLMHSVVDSGESRPGRHKAAPVLLPGGRFDASRLAGEFLEKSARIERSIASFVHRKLLELSS